MFSQLLSPQPLSVDLPESEQSQNFNLITEMNILSKMEDNFFQNRQHRPQKQDQSGELLRFDTADFPLKLVKHALIEEIKVSASSSQHSQILQR